MSTIENKTNEASDLARNVANCALAAIKRMKDNPHIQYIDLDKEILPVIEKALQAKDAAYAAKVEEAVRRKLKMAVQEAEMQALYRDCANSKCENYCHIGMSIFSKRDKRDGYQCYYCRNIYCSQCAKEHFETHTPPTDTTSNNQEV